MVHFDNSTTDFRGKAHILARNLDERIRAGIYSLGVKLPSERGLAEEFGMSRGTVRRVIDSFIEAGILRRATGSGTFVVAVPEGTKVDSARFRDVSPAELMEARLLFEPPLAGLIVRNARTSDFEAMEQCLVASEQASSAEEFEYWDGKFHQALGRASQNSFVVSVLEMMQQVRDSGEWGRLKRFAQTPERRARYEVQHRAIVDALLERDEVLATTLLRDHLLEVEENLFSERRSPDRQ